MTHPAKTERHEALERYCPRVEEEPRRDDPNAWRDGYYPIGCGGCGGTHWYQPAEHLTHVFVKPKCAAWWHQALLEHRDIAEGDAPTLWWKSIVSSSQWR